MTWLIGHVKQLTARLYQRSAVGCCLHILVDDCNIEDRHVDFCIAYAEERAHTECAELAKAYKELSLADRAEVLNMGWCVKCKAHSCCGSCHDCHGELVFKNKEKK